MDSKNSGIMAKLRNSKGFSLIELAIVLVIIGIIVAAILKGQDLLFNSRTKQIVSTANAWKVAAYGYMDRNNRFPGDSGRNGNISDEAAEKLTTGTATYELAEALSNVPPNPVVIGGQSYWFYFGSMPMATNGGVRNILTICPSVDCKTALSPDDIEMIKALDISLDGTADAGIGALRGLTDLAAGHGVSTVGATVAAPGNRTNGYVGALVDTELADKTVNGATVPWLALNTAGATTQYGAVWAFDKKF
jgi:prepilin-type N-terminal cleavage/methylation domain-containing protein